VLAQLKARRLAPTRASRGLSALIPAPRAALLALVVGRDSFGSIETTGRTSGRTNARGGCSTSGRHLGRQIVRGALSTETFEVQRHSHATGRGLSHRRRSATGRRSGYRATPLFGTFGDPGGDPGVGVAPARLIRSEIRSGDKPTTKQRRNAPRFFGTIPPNFAWSI
jgi:hypothetical protein